MLQALAIAYVAVAAEANKDVCGKFAVSTGSCPPGMTLATTMDMETCAKQLCKSGVLQPLMLVRGADQTKMLGGNRTTSDCQIVAYNRTLSVDDVLCEPEIPLSCAKFTVSSGGCAPGTTPASTEDMTKCASQLCGTVLEPYVLVRGADPKKVIGGSNTQSNCHVVPYDKAPVSDFLCEPVTDRKCQKLTISENTCHSGTPANLEIMTQCGDYLCNTILGTDTQVLGSNNTMVLGGRGTNSACKVIPTNKPFSKVLCQPAIPCSSLYVTYGRTCGDSAHVPATDDVISQCMDHLCSIVDFHGYAQGANRQNAFPGRLVDPTPCLIVPSEGRQASQLICQPLV